MNKNIIYKGIACVLLGASIFGVTSAIPLNQDIEAASHKTKICKHTTVEYAIGSAKEFRYPYTITISSVNGKNTHKHQANGWFYRDKKVEQAGAVFMSVSYSGKNKTEYYSSTDILFNGKTNAISNVVQKKVNGKLTSTSSSYSTKYLACNNCKFNKTSPTGKMTFKCPYCSQKAYVDFGKAKISKY